jgi:hypothetical protein
MSVDKNMEKSKHSSLLVEIKDDAVAVEKPGSSQIS